MFISVDAVAFFIKIDNASDRVDEDFSSDFPSDGFDAEASVSISVGVDFVVGVCVDKSFAVDDAVGVCVDKTLLVSDSTGVSIGNEVAGVCVGKFLCVDPVVN